MSLNETFTLGFQGWFYETLAAYDKDLKLVPQLAERWENPEPTKWIFHLRKGVKFHDGSPFTADDVIFSWKRSLTPGSDMKGYGAKAADIKIGRAHVCTPVTNAHLVCRLLLEKKKNNETQNITNPIQHT